MNLCDCHRFIFTFDSLINHVTGGNVSMSEIRMVVAAIP